MKETNEKIGYSVISIPFLIFFLGLISLFLFFNSKDKRNSTQAIKYRVDSVIFVPGGSESILQLEPYWKIKLEKSGMWIRKREKISIGDSVEVLTIKTNAEEKESTKRATKKGTN